MRPLLHTYMHVCQSPKCLTLDLSRIFPHPSIQNVFMLHSFHSIYTFSSCPSWPRRPLSRNVPMSRHIIDCFMSIFESLRYPYMHLYVHFIPHTHTHTPVSLRSLHFYWSSIAVPSRPLFRPLVSSTSFCIPPSKFFQTSHSSFLPFTLEKPAFVPKCLKSKCLTSSFPPLQSSISSSSHQYFIHISMYLSWIGFRPFSPSFCNPTSTISQSMHHACLISPLLHTIHSSFLPFVLEKPALVPYICILIRVWCWFSIQCASFHPFYPDLCIPHLKYLISIYLTSIYSSFIDTNHPYFLPFTLECLYVIHKSICWCICLVLGFPSNDSITFHIKVSHISLLPKTCHWTFFIPFFKPIFMLPIYPCIDPSILHWFSIHYA